MKLPAIISSLALLWIFPATVAADGAEAPDHMLLELLGEELDYSMQNLAMPDGAKPYYLAYTIIDDQSVRIGARLGALMNDDESRQRARDGADDQPDDDLL